jgi:D-aminopeptidase
LLRRWDTDFVPNSATLHMTTPHGGFDRSYFGTSLSGEGGIVSTVDDMLRWLAHMDAPVVGSAASWSAMKAPQDLANGQSTDYGLGLFIGRYRGVETLYHAGGVMGGNSQMLKVPAAGLDVAIMVNRADVIGMTLVNEILDACLPGLGPVRKVSPGPFATGVFRSPTTARVVQLFAKEGQQIVAIDGAEMPVEPDADGVLHPAGIFGHARRTVTLAGDPEKPSSIRLNQFGSTEELMPVHKPDRVDVGTIAGRYRSHSIGTEVTICAADEGARLISAGRFGTVLYSLECLADGIWRARPMNPTARDGVLSFARDGATFRFSNDRNWALVFHRVG